MATVFLSCGQRKGEREIAKQIEQMITDEFHMGCYNADSVQGFDDVMSIITEHLSKTDYYLFIDFKREPVNPGDLEISVFTHQEFALARAWEIKDIIAFQEEGLKSYGMLFYLLVHPLKFTRDRLVELVREEILRVGWNNNYSRNLVVSKLEPDPPNGIIEFTDHTGTSTGQVWFLWVQNHRKDRSAFDTVAILHSVTNEVTGLVTRPDSSYLKWAGQKGFHKTIFPQDEAHFSAFVIRVNQPGVFLHSAADVPRQPIINEVGRYKLEYRIFSESFPPVSVTVALDYSGPLKMGIQIQPSATSANLL
ncbi:MAG TPA: hypothetical protein VGM86_20695 [Thermoanaerobaculia bacterium]|jgi:hypothetical protein